MCFSPEASFAGGLLISGIGIATVRKIHRPSQLVFASIPLFFGIQQITEGLLWLTLPYSEYLLIQKVTTYLFLGMAEVVWPIMIPLSVLFMEKHPQKKKLLRVFLVIGMVLSAYYSFCLIFFQVQPQIMNYHIRYTTDFPEIFAIPAFLLYLVATLPPLFISSIPRTLSLGILLALSCLVTGLFFTQYLTSVWCFFAALISIVIFWIINAADKAYRLHNYG